MWPGKAGIKLSGGQFEAPNTWLPEPIAGSSFYLYLIVGIWSRKIVGWEVHERETAESSQPKFWNAQAGQRSASLGRLRSIPTTAAR